MAEASIPVDLLNPGQVFACLGFLEIADVVLGAAKAAFDWSNQADVRFKLVTNGRNDPFACVLEFVTTAHVKWLSATEEIVERDGGDTIFTRGVSESGEPKAADLPGLLVREFENRRQAVRFGFWADGSKGLFNTTFKKSTNGASSYIRLNNAIKAIREINRSDAVRDPFNQAVRAESLFRLDPRGSVDPINAGTSPDKLRKGGINMRMACYPIAEALAVIGLEYARPAKDGPSSFHYFVCSSLTSDPLKRPQLLPPELARAAVAGALPFLQRRRFNVDHEEVKKGGDRKMTNIVEGNP